MEPNNISPVSPPAGSPAATTPVAGGSAASALTVPQPSASPCSITRAVTQGGTSYEALPGTIRLRILSGAGIFQFDPLNCSVKDGANKVVPLDSNTTPMTLSFPVSAGNSYTLTAAFIANTNATATLVEDCKNQTVIDGGLNATQALGGRDYTFTVNQRGNQ
jgi:hypothetical protein